MNKEKNSSASKKEKISLKNQVALQKSFADYIYSPWIIPLILVFILLIVFSLRQISSLDIGFHLASGRWIIENFSFPSKDVFTYTVNDNEYVDMQWLFQVVNFVAFRIFGYDGITYLNILLMIILFVLIMRRLMYFGVPVSMTVLSLLYTLVSIQIRISNRPEIFSWIFILLTLIVMDYYYRERKKLLYLLPLIMFVWVNFHGLFIIGLFIILCYLISVWYEEKKKDTYLIKWFFISVAATLINPYFFEGAMFPFYLFTRLQASNIFKYSISELGSPFGLIDILPFEIYLYIFTAVVSFVLIFVTYRNRKFHEFIILSAFFYLSFSGYRNLPIFVIYSVYIITISVSDILLKYENRKKVRYGQLLRLIPFLLSVVIILLCLRVISGSYYASYRGGIQFGTGIDKNALPDKLTDYMIESGSPGKMINQIDLGGWLIWKLNQPVFIDGRLEVMKEDFFSEYNKSFKVNGLNYLVQKYKPSKLIFNHSTAYMWTDEINKMKGWNIEYFDENFALYNNDSGNTNMVNDMLVKYISYNKFDSLIAVKPIVKILEFEPESKVNNFIEGFYKKQNLYPELLSMGNFAMQNKKLSEAEIIFLNYLNKTKSTYLDEYHIDAFANLGEIYFSRNYYDQALICYENILKIDPENVSARRRSGEIMNILRSFKK